MAAERRIIAMAKQGSAPVDCPLAPPQHASVHARALHRACLIVGGIDTLAARLDVPKDMLQRWMRGDGEPPQSVFYAGLEIILLYVAQTPRAM